MRVSVTSNISTEIYMLHIFLHIIDAVIKSQQEFCVRVFLGSQDAIGRCGTIFGLNLAESSVVFVQHNVDGFLIQTMFFIFSSS